tara:strand:+ start:3781 stop:3987 length:207 start_codon:yes stop_codon:yes gene_type:complete
MTKYIETSIFETVLTITFRNTETPNQGMPSITTWVCSEGRDQYLGLLAQLEAKAPRIEILHHGDSNVQ